MFCKTNKGEIALDTWAHRLATAVHSKDVTFCFTFLTSTAVCEITKGKARFSSSSKDQVRQRQKENQEGKQVRTCPGTGLVSMVTNRQWFHGERCPTCTPAYRHVGWEEGQVLQGFQELALSTEKDGCSVNSHFCHCAFKATATGICPQQWQSIGHKGRCKASQVRRQDLAFLNELVHSLTLLTGKHVSVCKYIREN